MKLESFTLIFVRVNLGENSPLQHWSQLKINSGKITTQVVIVLTGFVNKDCRENWIQAPCVRVRDMIPCALRTFFCAPCIQICTLRTLHCAFRTLRLRSPYIALALSVLFALFVHCAFGDCAVRTPKFRPVWNHLSLLRVVRYVSPDVLALLFFLIW